MPLTSAQRRALKAQAHSLKPVVQTGARGVTEAVRAETDAALTAHELIKVRLAGSERAERQALAESLAGPLKAELVSIVGAVAVLYRPEPEAAKDRKRPKP